MELKIIPGTFAIVRMDPWANVPDWATAPSALSGVLRTSDELTIICEESAHNKEALAELDNSCLSAGWRGMRVTGTLDFALTGIVAGLSKTLADAGISLFALSTFDTDYLLVGEANLESARAALEAEGHSFAD